MRGERKRNNELDIDTLIFDRYNSKKKNLDLSKCINSWLQILMGRDWSKLKKLKLDEAKIQDQGLRTVLQLLHQNIKCLYLRLCKITPMGLMTFIEYCPTHLTQLDLSGNMLGTSGVKNLIKMNIVNLKQLSIRKCEIGEEGFKHLTKANWPSLRFIWLNDNMNNSEVFHQNEWKYLDELWITESKSIYCYNYLIFPSQNTKIENRNFIQIRNYHMRESIQEILQTKYLFK